MSLAAALVHSPPLLILDEPTVGVDPLLRQSIWKHLVTLAETEKITVLITTHYIEEARQANVVGLMRHGKLLAEDSPDNLMAEFLMDSLEDVFLKLCISDSSRRANKLAGLDLEAEAETSAIVVPTPELLLKCTPELLAVSPNSALLDAHGSPIVQSHSGRLVAQKKRRAPTKSLQLPAIFTVPGARASAADRQAYQARHAPLSVVVSCGVGDNANRTSSAAAAAVATAATAAATKSSSSKLSQLRQRRAQDADSDKAPTTDAEDDSSLTEFVVNKHKLRSMVPGTKYAPKKVSVGAWTKSLLAVTWKNYIRLKRNPPVLIFEFILPAVQVILFCLCIGGDPFDVPLAVVNDEVIPQASKFFLDAIDKKTIRQVPFENLTDAIESVRRGETWGAIHIPDRYTQFLQERLTHPADITNDTILNGTINIYPDLTNLHLALAMENTFREAFIKFAKDTLNMFGYDPASAELPIKVEQPVYGTLRRNGYLEFMTPGVVISITYVMATGLTALAFILEKRDGLLERSLVSGVTTSQILVAHASVQVVVMITQISLVLAFTFFVFDIPSNGPFFWVILLILLQGCTGMSFGLLVSALCDEENTAVMMLVGTFYTNLILAGIIWPLEAMPRWLRWVSYMQPQTLPTEALRNILSRGWGIGESGVYLGFVVTVGWLVVFLLAAGVAMRYSK